MWNYGKADKALKHHLAGLWRLPCAACSELKAPNLFLIPLTTCRTTIYCFEATVMKHEIVPQ